MLLQTIQILLPAVSLLAFSLLNCGGGKEKKATPKSTVSNASAETIKPPADQKAAAGTDDPNYQTMAGLGGECFGKDKAPGAAGTPGTPGAGGAAPAPAPGAPKAPVGGAPVAATHDPNYQTLAGVGGDCFGKDKKK